MKGIPDSDNSTGESNSNHGESPDDSPGLEEEDRKNSFFSDRLEEHKEGEPSQLCCSPDDKTIPEVSQVTNSEPMKIEGEVKEGQPSDWRYREDEV